jgi:hypothetical protein
MGQQRNAAIAAWQKNAGLQENLNPLLTEISNAAFELIKVIELEKSGIRDGDGGWSGSDVMGHVMTEMAAMCERYMRQSSNAAARTQSADEWFRDHTGFKSAAEAHQAHDYWKAVRDDRP